MDTAELLITLIAILCATTVVVYAIKEQGQQRRDHDHLTTKMMREMSQMAEWNGRMQRHTIDKLLAALTEPLNTPAPPQIPVHEQELAGQAQDAIRDFHDGFSGDVVDTPDWTDSWVPDARGDEPRVASVRPGDTIVPGQGNWEEMMGQGRAVVGDEVVSGEEQWEGEGYDDGR